MLLEPLSADKGTPCFQMLQKRPAYEWSFAQTKHAPKRAAHPCDLRRGTTLQQGSAGPLHFKGISSWLQDAGPWQSHMFL